MLQVSYRLTIDDAPADAEVMAAVREVEVEDHAELADMLRLRLAVAVREDGGAWSVMDDELFPRLAKLRVDISVGSRRVPLIEAHVIETSSQFSATPGESMVEVGGRSSSS